MKYDANMVVTTEDIWQLIEKLKCGKASGPDGISAESLRFSHDRLHVFTTNLKNKSSYGYDCISNLLLKRAKNEFIKR